MLSKSVVTVIVVALLLGALSLVYNIKNAYKILPVQTSHELNVPAFADWREFVAQAGKFKVMLPAYPQYAKESVPIPNMEDKKRKYEMYVAEKMNSTIFMMSLITYPQDVDTSDQKSLIYGVIHEMMVTNPNNRIQKTDEGTFDQYPATDFQIDNNEYQVEGKAFMIDKTLYLLTYIAKKENFNKKEYDHFIESFKLLPKATTQNPS